MGKKRVEVNEESQDTIIIDDTPQEMPLQEIPKRAVYKAPDEKVKENVNTGNEPVNCLRNERVIVRFVPRPTAMVQNPKHILFGGMADTATRSFVVPRLSSTGMFKNVLTDNEKNYLEKVMGLEYNALSVYRKNDNFWDDSNPHGIGRVTLHKQDNYLDLSSPEDYIKYKILLANKDVIAGSMQEMEDRPKATYPFVIISENAEAKMNNSRADVIMQCYEEFGSIRDDADTLKVVIELLEGRPMAPKVKLDFLKSKVTEYIQSKPKLFLATVKDELLPAKVLIKKALEAGVIGKKNDTYYLRQDGSPLCEMNEESTLNNAARYLSSVKHQDLKFLIEARVKDK